MTMWSSRHVTDGLIHLHGLIGTDKYTVYKEIDSTASINPLECRSNYSATSNDMKLVHWPLMGGLLHLVQR